MCTSLADARSSSGVAGGLDAGAQAWLGGLMTCNACEGQHCIPNHLSGVLGRVIACENHEAPNQTQIWKASLLRVPSCNEIQLNTHTMRRLMALRVQHAWWVFCLGSFVLFAQLRYMLKSYGEEIIVWIHALFGFMWSLDSCNCMLFIHMLVTRFVHSLTWMFDRRHHS